MSKYNNNLTADKMLDGLSQYCKRHPETYGQVSIVIYDDQSGHLAFDDGTVIPFSGFSNLLGLMEILEDENDTEVLDVPKMYEMLKRK